MQESKLYSYTLELDSPGIYEVAHMRAQSELKKNLDALVNIATSIGLRVHIEVEAA